MKQNSAEKLTSTVAPTNPQAWPLWLQISAFALTFAVLQGAWSFTHGTVLERLAVDGATVTPAAWLVNQLTPAVHATAVGARIHAAGGGVNVLNGCEGFEVLFLLVAALLVAPITWRRKLAGFAGGTLFVWLLNQGRIVALFYAYRADKALFALLHGTVAPLVMIVLATVAFVLYLGMPPKPSEAPAQTPS